MKKAPYSILPLLTGFFLLLLSCGQQTEISKPEKVGLSSDTLALAAQKMQEYIDQGKMAGMEQEARICSVVSSSPEKYSSFARSTFVAATTTRG